MMKTYRLFMIGWEYPPNITGGLGVACHGIARSLADNGNKIYFLLPRLYGDEPQYSGIELIDMASHFSLLARMRAEAPSLMVEALAAVTVPSFEKTGRSDGIFSKFTFYFSLNKVINIQIIEILVNLIYCFKI